MKHLRSCKEALDCVRTHLERRIISVQKECVPLAFEDGVKRLPDEILMCIFELGHQATSSTKFSFDVSHVCRRFRDVALATPQLWARLHGNSRSAMPMRQELVELLKSRFKQEDVEAIISIRSLSHFNHYYHERCVIDMASEYNHRWSYLQIDGGIPTSPLFPTMPTLSRLSRIQHTKRNNEMSTYPYEKWDLPKLFHFTGINVLPVFPMGSSIAVLELTLNLSSFTHHTGTRLVRTLLSLPRLYSLSLGFQSTAHVETAFSDVTIPVRLLKVPFKDSTDVSWATSFFSPISFPNLAQLEVVLEEVWPADDFMDLVLSRRFMMFSHVHTLRLTTSHKLRHGLLQQVFNYVPSVRDLFVDTPCTVLLPRGSAPSSNAPCWPPLQTLCIKHSTTLSDRQMEDIVDKIRLDGNWEQFKSFEVVACAGLSEGFLFYIASKMDGKLEWTHAAAAWGEAEPL
ncbi:hypothetical protein BD410DRAFT_886411 [Rickenella mellea]|uniref:F-box domain-containing protein n=1 Tax=Rickenella mellea TaxID=50990 RepID=A0A4Y7PNF9_9AGAM|nr:hypothetical protein BD410DRAFT_886411 [Rickenella mellea]